MFRLFFAFFFVFLASSLSAETLPDGAILLFGTDSDGKLVNRFLSKEGTRADWKVENGELISTSRPVDAQNPVRSNHVYSEEMFRDALIHVEFNVAPEASGNCGVYIHGNYEMQIYDSAKIQELNARDLTGAIYNISAPLVNASKPVGEWQTYEIEYRAPRRDAKGKITRNGRITAWLNGLLVQENAEFGEPVSQYHPYRYGATENLRQIWANQIKTGYGPVFLQDHQSPTRFRKVWIKKLD